MSVFWYISEAKVSALAQDPGFFSRLSAKVGFSIGLASAEVSVAPGGDALLKKKLARVQKRLRKDGAVTPLHSLVQTGGSVPLFEYEGESSRVSSPEAYWVAALAGDTAILLVGSITNAIGGAAQIGGQFFSPAPTPWAP